ncbi:leucine-rich repeat domain-containing protein [uncultured Treponema sp.]|uniref:leucine-rich repeat domain-containing protein n=1 Tax=uncultured Treponema sp. TaxID=162155 RepID=UPI00260F29AD|nr:leucine-rich repeat domain-containing protein [uncultured Treponema sp.]
MKKHFFLTLGLLMMTSVMFTSCGGKKKNNDTASSDLEKQKIYGFFTGENDFKKRKPITVKELLKAEPLTDADFKVVFTKDKKGVIITDFIGKDFIDKKTPRTCYVIPATIQGFPVVGIKSLGQMTCHGGTFSKRYPSAILIPEGVRYIAGLSSGVSECYTLILPSTLEVLFNDGIYNFGRLGFGTYTSCELPPNLKIISQSIFDGSAGPITKVTIPPSVKFIADGAFRGTTFHTLNHPGPLREISLPEGLLYIGSSAFENTRISNLTIPKSVKWIGAQAFWDCDNLSEINWSDDWTVCASSLIGIVDDYFGYYKDWGVDCSYHDGGNHGIDEFEKSLAYFFSCGEKSKIAQSLAFQEKLKDTKIIENKVQEIWNCREMLNNELNSCLKEFATDLGFDNEKYQFIKQQFFYDL